MGKGGGGELNVSSDLTWRSLRRRMADRWRHGEFAGRAAEALQPRVLERLGKRLIAALSEATADARLPRRHAAAAARAMPVRWRWSNAMLEEYLLREGRDWERFAC